MNDSSKELEREAARLRDRAIAMQEQLLRFMREMGAALDVLDQDTRALSERVAATFAETSPPPAADQ